MQKRIAGKLHAYKYSIVFWYFQIYLLSWNSPSFLLSRYFFGSIILYTNFHYLSSVLLTKTRVGRKIYKMSIISTEADASVLQERQRL